MYEILYVSQLYIAMLPTAQ